LDVRSQLTTSAVVARPTSISCAAASSVRTPVAQACISVGPPTRPTPTSPVSQGRPKNECFCGTEKPSTP
jgi:hypothetical protein